MNSEALAEALLTASRAIQEQGGGVNLLERGGLTIAEVDLSSAALESGIELKAVQGFGLRMLRAGSNPGARLELAFGGRNKATNFFVPGQKVHGGFKTVLVKRAPGCARVGKATFVVQNKPGADFREDLIVSALGPVDLLGATDPNGDPATWVAVPENTDPNAAFGTQTGAFDGSGWEMLRVMVRATGLTGADVHFFHNPSWTGTSWQHCSVDGVINIGDSPTTGFAQRTFLLPWGGRGVGCPAVYNLAPGALAALDFIIQGVR